MTRAEAESEVLESAAAGMGLVGISTTVGDDGFVPTLNTALRAGLKAVGITPASRTVSDADFATVSGSDEDKLVAVATLSILDRVLLSWDTPNITDNGSSQAWGDLYDKLSKRADLLRTTVGDIYGVGGNSISVGSMSLNTFETADDDEWGS